MLMEEPTKGVSMEVSVTTTRATFLILWLFPAEFFLVSINSPIALENETEDSGSGDNIKSVQTTCLSDRNWIIGIMYCHLVV